MAANTASGPSGTEASLSAIEIQQEYYQAVGDIDWELYEKKDRKYLLQKIAVALCGPPTRIGNLTSGDDLVLQGYDTRVEEITMKVFNKICEQAKYSQSNEEIVISVIRVVCVTPSQSVPIFKPTPPDYWVDLHSKKNGVQLCIFHVFSIRKCIPKKAGEKGCRVFIDHDGRVYQNWNAYLKENHLPECVMVVPENGEYKGTLTHDGVLGGTAYTDDFTMPTVKCSVVPSPALGLEAKVLSVADRVSTVANIGVLLGVAGGLLVPAVAPLALGTAMGVGTVTGAYAIVRSSMNLVDRSKHEQSIGLDNSEARASWINIMVSTAGISASGATKLLSWAAASGTKVEILMSAVRFLHYTNLGSGFIGVANSLVDMIIKYAKYNEPPTALEVFQFTTSALFFGIGAMSNQTAQEIVQDAQATTINEYRDALSSNVKKKMFDKVTAETRRVQGTIQGNSDIIKSLQKIDNKNDFFAKLANVNKQMNKNKLRISLSPDGNPLLNNQHKIGVRDLHGLGKSGRDQLFTKIGPSKLTTKNAATRIYASSSSATAGSFSAQETQCYIRPEEIIKISHFLISLCKADRDFIVDIISEISADVHNGFLLFCAELIGTLVPFEIEILLSLDRDYKLRIVLFVFNYIKSKIHIDDDMDVSFANVLKMYIKNGTVDRETIKRIKEKLMQNTLERMEMNDDPRKYDGMHNFRKSGFQALEAGEIVTIGSHHILVNGTTVEKIGEWLTMLSQGQCDTFLSLCYKIISDLSSADIEKLIEINFDEDIILRVTHFLLYGTDGVLDILLNDLLLADVLADVALHYKMEMMDWRSSIDIRKYEHCNKCFGICFK